MTTPRELQATIESLILQAEKEFPGQGLEHGLERQEWVTDQLLKLEHFPLLSGPRGIALVHVQMVYETIAKNLPANLRSTPAPVPKREE